jgi:UDP-glucose 4-epimerase
MALLWAVIFSRPNLARKAQPMARYLVTGGAGFIGSNLVHALVARGDQVCVIDDFSTGHRAHLALLTGVEIVEGSILDRAALDRAMVGVDFCLHQAAVPSVPRSVKDPLTSNRANVEGSLNVFLAAREAGVKRVVYASSSSVYGRAGGGALHEGLPLAPVSPYAVSKAAVEQYAGVFTALYGIQLVGLRYFNVFGPRQDPESPYAAVVPKFVQQLRAGERPAIHGDGRQSRDFTYVENVVQANIRACETPDAVSGVYNIACGASASVVDLAHMLGEILGVPCEPAFGPPRQGDILHSLADITRARAALGYAPEVSVREGLTRTAAWYVAQENVA